MTDRPMPPASRVQLVPKLAAMALIVGVVGLPLNDFFLYLLLVMAALVLAAGRVVREVRAWAAALLLVFVAISIKLLVSVPRIEEGHNAFVPDGADNALVTGLPEDVFRAMAAEFERASQPDNRCDPKAWGCWRSGGRPDRVYAFSFDGLYDKPLYSRRVTDIDFSSAVWQRLGFVNELRYNWRTLGDDIGRGYRLRGLRGMLQSWRITLPHFVMYNFSSAHQGSRLCWRGLVLWEEAPDRFSASRHADMACRTIEARDAGRRIYGVAIVADPPLAMRLEPTASIRLHQLVHCGVTVMALIVLLFLLVRWRPRDLRLPFVFVGLSLLVIGLNDATFLGGMRPFDAGNDGLAYDGWSRGMVQLALAGDISGALRGFESVFHFTPGSRYLRAVEHLIFGETYLGYVSLLLLLPFLVFASIRRYFSAKTALAAALVFIAIPIGALFGSTFYLYVKYAAQGFGDAAAAILFLSGLLSLVGCTRAGPDARFAPALGAGLLFALALFVRPNLAVGAAFLLGGAGLAALWQGQYRRLAGMCVGFLPVFGMALHNWYYGGVFVLFSGHLTLPEAMPAPPSLYAAALRDLVQLNIGGDSLSVAVLQVTRALTGPSEHFALVPLHLIAIAVLFRVLASGRYDGWLRLIAAGSIGLHGPALFFLYAGRYHHLAWLLTLLVGAVWFREEALPLIRSRFPAMVQAAQQHPAVAPLSRSLDRIGPA